MRSLFTDDVTWTSWLKVMHSSLFGKYQSFSVHVIRKQKGNVAHQIAAGYRPIQSRNSASATCKRIKYEHRCRPVTNFSSLRQILTREWLVLFMVFLQFWPIPRKSYSLCGHWSDVARNYCQGSKIWGWCAVVQIPGGGLGWGPISWRLRAAARPCVCSGEVMEVGLNLRGTPKPLPNMWVPRKCLK